MERTQVQVETSAAAPFLERAFAEARPVLAPWFGEDLLRENLTTEIARDLAATRDDGVCTMDLSCGRAVVYIQPGELTEPMPEAHIRHRTFAIESVGQLRHTAREVREHLVPYPPETVLVYTYGDVPLADLMVNMRVVAGMIDELNLPGETRPLPPIRLEEPASLDFYDEYYGWYEEFWRRRPHLKDEIRVEDREDLEECQSKGGLRLVYVEDELAGLLAAQPRVEFGLCGWRMRERVTSPSMWGRGVSTAALVAFAKSLPPFRGRGGDAIWGTIIPANDASFNSASRVGRRVTAILHEID